MFIIDINFNWIPGPSYYVDGIDSLLFHLLFLSVSIILSSPVPTRVHERMNNIDIDIVSRQGEAA